MSSFYDDASLVVIPSGYKTSKVYAEKPTDGSGDLAFTRTGDTATRVNSAGLIERVRTNLVLQSQTFDNASWTKLSATITANTSAAPDGTTTADTLVITTGGYLLQGFASFSAVTGSRVAISIYAKNQTNGFLAFGGATPAGTDVYSIQDVGSGWYRHSVLRTFTTTATATVQYIILTVGTHIIWGAQFENDVTTPYIVTTTAPASIGPVANVPRLDYLGSTCPRLLLEPQRTNVITYSEQPNNATWTKSAGGTGTVPVVTANDTISPDGYQNADKVVFNSGAGTTSADQSMLEPNAFSVTNGTTYTGSFWARGAVGGEQLAFRHVGAFTKVTLTTSWQRYTLTTTAAYTGTGYFTVGIRRGLVEPLNSSATVYIWGAQLEVGAYATSYIPTLAASATRGADALSLLTLPNSNMTFSAVLTLASNPIGTTAGDWLSIGPASVLGRAYGYAATFGFADAYVLSATAGRKIAWKQESGTTAKIFSNGSLVGTSTTGTYSSPFVQFLISASFLAAPLRIESFLFFDAALSDSDLQTLTTL